MKHDALSTICAHILDKKITKQQARKLLTPYINHGCFTGGWDRWLDRKLVAAQTIRRLPQLEDIPRGVHGTMGAIRNHWMHRQPLCTVCEEAKPRIYEMNEKKQAQSTERRQEQFATHFESVKEWVAAGRPLCELVTDVMKEPIPGTNDGAKRHRKYGQPPCEACTIAERTYNQKRKRNRDATAEIWEQHYTTLEMAVAAGVPVCGVTTNMVHKQLSLIHI